ncbi:ankyrin repeat and MYND domain-containing protein 1 [Amia ocellicauda]|uniref:ankyrin repeat and MYND domain-containing protein 1 n=1 Tax=Amia ocellicauda TaxID=2972642 RepID=UPI00346414C1
MPSSTGSAAGTEVQDCPACGPGEQAARRGRYTGASVGGQKHGAGVQEWPDSSRYEGQFVDGLKHGTGAFTWSNGEVYKGEFFKDYRHGHGTYSWPGGCSFTGSFYLNRKEGYGTLQLPDGTTFQGLYRADERFGPGVLTYPDGRQDVGLWHRERLLKLCTRLPGAFSLHDFPEHQASLGPRDEISQEPERAYETQAATKPFYYAYMKLLEDERFMLPPEIVSYSSDSDHLPLPQSLRRELDERFFGEHCCDTESMPTVLDSLPLQLRIRGHIRRHRLGAEGLDWDVAAVLSGRREAFGPKGPLEVNSERLIQEASEGDPLSVYTILRGGLAHPDVGDARGHTPLIAAAVNCHNDVINILLNSGADVNQLSDEGLSALAVCHVLYYPSHTFHSNMAEGLDRDGQEEELASSCEETANPESSAEPPARTIQVRDGRIHLGSVSWPQPGTECAAGGLDVKESPDDPVFDSARSLASFHIDVTEDALQQTAEALSRNSLAQRSISEETVRRMALMKAEHRNRWATIKLLLCRGADPNASSVPMPVLFLAIKAGHVQAVRRLLQCGARTDVPLPKRQKGLYPLHIAAALPGKEGVKITELLLHAAANPDVRAQDAEDVFSLDKVSSSHPPLGFSMKSTTPLGPPVQYYSPPDKLPEEGGRTPLHIACQRDIHYTNAREVISLLLCHKADPNLLWSGHSPLSLAIASGNDDAIDELLAGGADPNLPLSGCVGSALCATANIYYDPYRSPRQTATLIDKLVNAGANILMPVVIGEGRKTVMGTAVDYAYYAFYQDRRIAHTPYHALSAKEREVFNGRRELLALMGDLLRQAAVGKERERLERELELGIASRSPTEKFVYTGTGASSPLTRPGDETSSSSSSSRLAPGNKGQAAATGRKPNTIRKPLFKYCYQCGRTMGVQLAACSRCHEVFYCSKACKMKAWSERHKDECLRVTGKARDAQSAPPKPKTQQRPDPSQGNTGAGGGHTREGLKTERGPAETLATAGITENYSFN